LAPEFGADFRAEGLVEGVYLRHRWPLLVVLLTDPPIIPL